MSDPDENPDGYDPLGGGIGDKPEGPSSPVDGSNPAVGPDAEAPADESGSVQSGPENDVPPRGYPEQ